MPSNAVHCRSISESVSRRRVSGLALSALLPLLSACGGGGDPLVAGVAAAQAGSEIGEGIGNAINCIIQGCVESNTVSIDNVSTHFTITQTNGVVRVDASLGKSANLFTTLMLSPGDSLSASDGDGPALPLKDVDGTRTRYAITFPDTGAQPRVTVNFQRGTDVYPNVVTMLAPFTLSPLGPVALQHSAGGFDLQIQPASMPSPSGTATANCTRQNGNSLQTTISLVPLADIHVPGQYRITTQALDAGISAASQNQMPPDNSPTASCKLSLVWSISTLGTVSSSLNRHGTIQATRSINQVVNYDVLN